jgi:hypothetical protein
MQVVTRGTVLASLCKNLSADVVVRDWIQSSLAGL